MLLPKKTSSGVRVEEVGQGLVGVLDGGVRAPGGLEGAVGVGVAPHQIVGHGVDHRLGHLRAAGTIKKDTGRLPELLAQGGELFANGGYVESHGLGLTGLIG